jgi:hypothetical protein
LEQTCPVVLREEQSHQNELAVLSFDEKRFLIMPESACSDLTLAFLEVNRQTNTNHNPADAETAATSAVLLMLTQFS